MPHEKLTPIRAEDELNVERFTYKKSDAGGKKQTDMRADPYDSNGYRKNRGDLSGGGWLAEHQRRVGK